MESIKPWPKIFVSHIGLDFINVGGEDRGRFSSLPGAAMELERLIIRCDTNEQRLEVLQLLIDKKTPFAATYKMDPARNVLLYKDRGEVSGDIITVDWGAGGAIYEIL